MATIDLIVLGMLKRKSLSAYDIPATGMAVLHQQFQLVQAIKEWIRALKEELL